MNDLREAAPAATPPGPTDPLGRARRGRVGLRVLRSVAGYLALLLGVTFVIYVMVFALPGDPVAGLAGDRPLPESTIAAIRAQYHLDEPLWQQYLRYLGGLLTGDLGTDFRGRPVADQLAAAWPVTVTLALTAWGIELVVGMLLGLWAGLRAGRLTDRVILAGTVLVTSIPVFVLAVSSQLVLGVELRWFPVAGQTEGWPTSFLLPASVIAVFGLAAVSRLMRGSVVESLRSDYVRTLRAQGLPRREIVGVHVLRNACLPVLTFLAVDLGYLLGGAVVVEGVFNLPGVGKLLFDAIRGHEGPTIVGVSTALIVLFLLTNAAVDALSALLDPRIRR